MNAPQTQLVHYEAARKALAAAHNFDEVKDIRDKAVAMQAYATQANDKSLIDHATEIRLRAEMRAGELLAGMEKAKGTRSQLKGSNTSGGRAKLPPEKTAPTLQELGISKTQSSKWQRLAALPEKEQEAKIEQAKRGAEKAVNAAPKPSAPKPPKPRPADPKQSAPKLPACGVMSPKDVCCMEIRRIVLGRATEIPPSEWAQLLSALREELDDIETTLERRRENGHHPAHESP